MKRGFRELTPVQSAVLAAELEGRDLQISSQTGSGKTVALGFVLAPRLEGEATSEPGPSVLVIVPTRELAAQVCDELGWLLADLPGADVASVTGGTPLHRDRRTLARRPRVLVGTPGRLLDHVRSGALVLRNVHELVLDEADQMLDMGFREDLEAILDAIPVTRRTHLVSATFPPAIRRLAETYQRDPVAIEGTRLGDANENIVHQGHLVLPRDRYAALVNLLLMTDGERTLVFVERRADAVEVAERLEADGFAALPLSGELAQSVRDRTLAAFRAGRATVLVATDVAARGLDVPDVATVIHTSVPIDSQVYTHRSGRTGRAGKQGRSILFAAPNRRRRVAALLSEAGVEIGWEPVPSAEEVRAHLDARASERLESEVDRALDMEPTEARLIQAQELLAGRDALSLVAALLSRLEPEHPTRPRDVESPRPSRAPRRAEGQRGTRPDRSGDLPAGPDPRPAGSRRRAGRDGAVRFFMNWGANQGASPGRLLAAVCRRGQLSGDHIGSIAIHPNASTFDVSAEVAESFERLAGRRDARDPRTLIRRDRGPQVAGRR